MLSQRRSCAFAIAYGLSAAFMGSILILSAVELILSDESIFDASRFVSDLTFLVLLSVELIYLNRYARAANAARIHTNTIVRFTLLCLEYLVTATLLTFFTFFTFWFAFQPTGGASNGSFSILFFTIPKGISQVAIRILAGGCAVFLIAKAISAWKSGLRDLRIALSPDTLG